MARPLQLENSVTRSLLLVLLAALCLAAPAQANKGTRQITKAEAETFRKAVRPLVKEHLANHGGHYIKPSISIPQNGMKRTENGGIEGHVSILAVGRNSWSPIPKRLVKEVATYKRGPRGAVKRSFGWIQIEQENPAKD